MKWSIVIPAYTKTSKLAGLLTKCIQSIKKNTEQSHEIIVVESGLLEMDYEVDKLLKIEKQTCFAKAVNYGVSIACGDCVVICNSDVEVPEGWEKAIRECFEQDNCIVGTIQSSEENLEPYNAITEDFFGGFWVTPRNKWLVFDEHFINSFEDADYWLRARKVGKLYKNNKCQILHHVKQSVALQSDEHDKLYGRNRQYFNEKWINSKDPLFQKLR